MSARELFDIRFPASFHPEQLVGPEADTLRTDILHAIQTYRKAHAGQPKPHMTAKHTIIETYTHHDGKPRITLYEDIEHGKTLVTLSETLHHGHEHVTYHETITFEQGKATAKSLHTHHPDTNDIPVDTVDIRKIGKRILDDLDV